MNKKLTTEFDNQLNEELNFIKDDSEIPENESLFALRRIISYLDKSFSLSRLRILPDRKIVVATVNCTGVSVTIEADYDPEFMITSLLFQFTDDNLDEEEMKLSLAKISAFSCNAINLLVN